MDNQSKVLDQDSMSQNNVTNPDKLKLANYNRKICNIEIFQVQNFGRKILMIQHALIKFIRHFHLQSFTLYGGF